MQFINNFEQGKKTVIDKYPKLSNCNFKADDSGWTNYAIKVDDKYLFRFPRNEEAYAAIRKEYKILEILNKKLPFNIQVPKYIFSELDKDYPFVGYELIQGEFLTNELFDSLTENKKEEVLNSMAEFLNILHSIDYRDIGLEPVNPIEWYKDLYNRIQRICFKYFDDDLKKRTVELFEMFFNDETMHNYKSTLVHGDLSEDHIIVTNTGVGIIDFGDLMAFDPAYDLIWAYICDKGFYYKLYSIYQGNKDDYFEHRIRDFHIIRPPYDGIIYADEIKDDEMLNHQLQRLKNNFMENDQLRK